VSVCVDFSSLDAAHAVPNLTQASIVSDGLLSAALYGTLTY
jgi:hypothetical protein